ncbi:hypothetical protein B0T09DRAFT_390551 [Sordaria sp. MPI-SDFR-AT-0083]|nr:hypothetical protein B0T09DRAFT_390551 [Sordaria sp. MPI-SDFR-AT-0083]
MSLLLRCVIDHKAGVWGYPARLNRGNVGANYVAIGMIVRKLDEYYRKACFDEPVKPVQSNGTWRSLDLDPLIDCLWALWLEKQKEIISERPLADTLDRVRNNLCDSNEADNTYRESIASLLGALILSPAAHRKTANLDPFRPLVRLVVDNHDDNSNDNAIWAAVFSFLDTLTPRTPRLRPTVPSTFFNPESWRNEQKAILEKIKTAHNGTRWTGFPAIPDEKLVWDWLCSLEERFLAGAPNKLHITASAHQFEEWKGQMDIFFQASTTEVGILNNHKNILVVGEQKNSYEKRRFKADFLQFTCYADMFARALVGYAIADVRVTAMMDAEAMGLDTFIQRVIERGRKKRYIMLNDTGDQTTRIRLDKAIVVKFVWASGKRTAEVGHLTQAKEKCVKGVAGIVAHHRITTIAEIRKRLQFPTAHRFLNGGDDLSSASTSTNTSGYKRKSSSDATTDTISRSNKKQRSDSQKLIRKLSPQPSSSTSKTKPTLFTPSCYDPTKVIEDLWEDRIYSCLVISPAGHIISEFTDIKQLLESMRDAIKAHKFLFVTGNILHRDISPNNIIITDPETADGFKGMLIDLDMVKAQNSGPSGARQITGTSQFIAIEVLRKIDHIYHHDL